MKPRTDRGNIVRFCLLWALLVAWGSAIASPKTLPRLPIWPTFDYGLGKSVGNREIQKQGPNDELFLWRVDGENSTVYLMGSIHLLKKSSYPLAPLYEYVYDECNQLVVETNESGSDEHNEYLMNKMLLGGNKKLSHYISKSAYNWIQDLAIDNDLPSDFFNQFKPEAVGLFIAQIKAENYGFDLTLGVDFHFIDKAEDDFIPIYSLEGVERYDLFFTGSLAKQADELEDFINEIKKGKAEKELAELVDSWLNDYERMVKFLLENQKKDKKDNDISLKTRNIAWVPEIEKYIKQANVTLVISGAAHFFGDYGVVKLLENKGYKVNQLHDVDIPKVSFSEAIKSDNLTAVKTYIQIHPNLNNYYYDAATPENSAYCPLHTAVKNGKFESVKLLLAAGANINRLTLTQASPIYLAAQEGYLDILKYLFSQGGNIHNTSDDGWSPLHAAAYFSQHLEPIKYLLSVGASIDAKTNAGSTPLYWAIRKGNYDIADYLISNGADLDSKDDAGRTALHKYIKYDRIESAQYILNKGADINAKDNDGFTPIHFAASIEGSVVKITRDEILLENFPNMTLRDFLDSKILFNPLVSQLLSNGANTELTTNRYRMTPLCLAVAIGYYGNAIDLINEGANVNAISSYAGDQVNDEITIGFSPLMLATESDDFKMVKLLAENGADVSYKTGNGKTAHLIAIEEGYLEIAEYLKEKTTQKTLFQAVKDNDIDSLKKHISANTNLNQRDEDNSTALHYAALYGFLEFAELLIKNGASVNAKGVSDTTSLHAASTMGHLEVVELLINNGALINTKFLGGLTALHAAAVVGHLGIVELLINKGASIDAKSEDDATALLVATGGGHFKVVELLIKNGASIDLALNLAAAKGHLAISDLLIKNGASIDAKDEGGVRALHHAAFGGFLKVVELLIKNGASIDAKDKDGSTALHHAAEEGHLEVVELLIENGASINSKDDDGITAILKATYQGHLEVVKIFIKNKANLDGAIIFASFLGNLEILELLINGGALIESKGKEGKTSLHFASEAGNLSIVELLLNNGANYHALTETGKTALVFARENEHTDVVSFLEEFAKPEKSIHQAAGDNDILSLRKHIAAKMDLDEKGGDDWTALHYSAFKGFSEFSEILINNGASIDAKQKNGWTALHFASYKGHLEIVETLIKNGASIDAKQQDEWTALHLAVKNNHLGVVEILINNGASIDAKQKNGWTALHFASYKGHLEIVETLIKNGASIDAKQQEEWTALHEASSKGHLEIVETLIKNGASIDAKQKEGWTALHFATFHGFTAVVSTLIDNGANTDLRTNAGHSALDIAIQENHIEIQKLLKAHAAPVIVKQPQSMSVPLGMIVETLEVIAEGENLKYQWYKDNAKIEGATKSTYEIFATFSEDVGEYYVTVSNESGTVTSETAVISLEKDETLKISAFKYSGQFQFDINGMKGATFLIEASTDLKLWAPIGEFKNRDGVVKFSDRTSPLFDQQFYRVKVVE